MKIGRWDVKNCERLAGCNTRGVRDEERGRKEWQGKERKS